MDFKKSFGFNVRFYRKSKNMTQEQLAELIGLDQRQVTRIENGISFVSANVLERLADVLNIDIKQLFEFEDVTCEINNTAILEKLLDKLKKLSKNESRLNYINLAFDSLTNKEARSKLLTMLEGMELLQK